MTILNNVYVALEQDIINQIKPLLDIHPQRITSYKGKRMFQLTQLKYIVE
jgi:50S ribosomal subunit-associated GTPase HflX